jgi:hypothetical protein
VKATTIAFATGLPLPEETIVTEMALDFAALVFFVARAATPPGFATT